MVLSLLDVALLPMLLPKNESMKGRNCLPSSLALVYLYSSLISMHLNSGCNMLLFRNVSGKFMDLEPGRYCLFRQSMVGCCWLDIVCFSVNKLLLLLLFLMSWCCCC